MTANHAHTPLDDLVLRMHIHFGAANTMGDDRSADDFASVIRILENMPAKIAAAEQRGAAIALRDLADSLTAGHDLETDTRIFDPWDVAEILLARADRIANKENE